jgi:hypothetical protein
MCEYFSKVCPCESCEEKAEKRKKDEQGEFKKFFNEAILRFLQADEAVQKEVKLTNNFKTFAALLKVVDESGQKRKSKRNQ